MKATPILIILLIASLCYNVFQHFKCRETKVAVASLSETVSDSAGCVKLAPYAPAIVIDAEPASDYFNQFVTSLASPDSTNGGIISTAAFEAMMCDEKCNGIAYSFARDKDGTTGPGANGIFVILQAVNVEYDDGSGQITKVNAIPGALKYRSGNWCPVNCMAW